MTHSRNQHGNPDTASSSGSSFHTRSLRIFFHQHLNVLKPPQRFKITNSLWICVFIPSNFAYRCKAGNPLPCNQSQIFPLELLCLTLLFTLWHVSLLLPCKTASDLSTTHCSTCCESKHVLRALCCSTGTSPAAASMQREGDSSSRLQAGSIVDQYCWVATSYPRELPIAARFCLDKGQF